MKMVIEILQTTTFWCRGQLSQIVHDLPVERVALMAWQSQKKIQERPAHLADESATKPFYGALSRSCENLPISFICVL